MLFWRGRKRRRKSRDGGSSANLAFTPRPMFFGPMVSPLPKVREGGRFHGFNPMQVPELPLSITKNISGFHNNGNSMLLVMGGALQVSLLKLF